MSPKRIPYKKYLKPYSRKLRTHGTPGEAYIWYHLLSRRQFHGYQFNRQFPIDVYIVDFICRKLKLVLEIDGSSHDHKQEADRKRDARLNELGFQVLRVGEAEVFKNLDNVIRALEAYLPDIS